MPSRPLSEPSDSTTSTSPTGSAWSRPSAESRRTRPGRSVTSARPSGSHAIAHGVSRPLATVRTFGPPSELVVVAAAAGEREQAEEGERGAPL